VRSVGVCVLLSVGLFFPPSPSLPPSLSLVVIVLLLVFVLVVLVEPSLRWFSR